MRFDFQDGCLEFLASQTEFVKFSHIISTLSSENCIEPLEKAEKVDIWLQLCANHDIITVDEQGDANAMAYVRSSPGLTAAESRIQLLEEKLNCVGDDLIHYIDNSKLIASNGLRIRKFNFVFCENVFKSPDRFRILLAIISRRYEGYWHHDLVNDIGISPRELFTHLTGMMKMSLLCKVSLSRDYISKHMLRSKLDKTMHPEAGIEDMILDKRLGTYQATMWFHTRYFVMERLPLFVQETFLNSTTQEMEEHLLKILKESQNQIVLDTDWKKSYIARVAEDCNLQLANIDNRLIKKAYLTLRSSLEERGLITRVFAWCPQTKSFERCIVPKGCTTDMTADLDNKGGELKTVNISADKYDQLVLSSDSSEATSAHKAQNMLYQLQSYIYGHTIEECVYYLVKCNSRGVSLNDLVRHLGIRYKLLMKLINRLDSSGVFSKESVRVGKLLMYLYTIKGRKATKKQIESNKRELAEQADTDSSQMTEEMSQVSAVLSNTSETVEEALHGSSDGIIRKNEADVDEIAPSVKKRRIDETTAISRVDELPVSPPMQQDLNNKHNSVVPTAYAAKEEEPDDSNQEGMDNEDSAALTYESWVNAVMEMYTSDAAYLARFRELFGVNYTLPKNVKTSIFHRRMVLMADYIEHFKAANCKTISKMYGDIEQTPTVVDRKTVNRVYTYVQSRRSHIKRFAGHILRGVLSNVTVFYDSRRVNEEEAFRAVTIEMAKKRAQFSMKASSYKNRINETLKSSTPSFESGTIPDSTANDTVYMHSLAEEEEPLLFKAVEVNKLDRNSPFATLSRHNQLSLKNNGYVFPVVTRVRFLHMFLLNSIGTEQRFSALTALNKMPMDLYLQVVGCGIEIHNIPALLEGDILPEHNSGHVYDAIFRYRGPRDAVAIMHRMLNILANIGLLKIHTVPVDSSTDIPQCEIEWEVVRVVSLRGIKDPDKLIGSFDLLASFDEFWDSLKSEVWDYIALEKADLPRHMPLRHLFNKKNWKVRSYVHNLCKTHLDHTFSTWYRMTIQGMDDFNLERLLYIPPYIMDTLVKRHRLSRDEFHHFVLYHLRKVGHQSTRLAADDRILSVVKNLTDDIAYIWLGKYVFSERLCNAAFYDMLNSTATTSKNSSITWGELRAKMRGMGKTDAPRQENRMENDTSDVSGPASSEEATLRHDGLGKTQNQRHEGDSTPEGKPRDCKNGISIWHMMSIMFDNEYSPKECLYIFSHIMNHSSGAQRLLPRLRDMRAVYINRTTLGRHVGSNWIAANKAVFKDQEKALLKSLIFTPVVRMRPWFLKNLEGLKRATPLLQEWYENRWVSRTKQNVNIYTLFKLSSRSKANLFGRFGDIKMLANLLDSHYRMHMDMCSNFPKDISTLGSSIGSKARKLNDASSLANATFLCNWDSIDMRTTYMLMEHFLNGTVSFNPIWQKGSSNRESKRARVSYDRLSTGGISRHLQELTPDVVSIKTVNIAVSHDPSLLGASENLTDLFQGSMTMGTSIPRELLCNQLLSDTVNPLECPASTFTENVDVNYPLCNYEYTCDKDHGWWDDRHYTAVPLQSYDHKLCAERTAHRSEENNGCNDSAPTSEASGNSSQAQSGQEHCNRDEATNLNGIFKRVIDANYGTLPIALERVLCDMEIMLYDVLEAVKSAGSLGIKESRLQEMVLQILNEKEEEEIHLRSGHTINLKEAIFESLLLTAELLRFVTKLPSQEQFCYLYWEYSSAVTVPKQHVVAIRQYNKNEQVSSEGPAMVIQNRPEYITPILWLIHVENLASNFKEQDLKSTLGPLYTLIYEKNTRQRYMRHLKTAPLGTFVSIDGHFNTCLLAFLMLRISSMLKASPGQTVKELWEKFVILDQCEVEFILTCMTAIGMCRRSFIAIASEKTSIHTGECRCECDSDHYYIKSDSSWLCMFKSLLLSLHR